jgi:hypothetical protein
MTLCIAVKCNSVFFGPQVVCCFDSQVGNEFEATESERKWHALSPYACAMFAGPLMPAKDLLQLYKKALKKNGAFKIETYKDVLWKPMHEFIESNQDKVHQENTDVQLLIVAIVKGSFRLLSLDENGIREHPYFGAIGTGGDSATAMLRWRKPTGRTHPHLVTYYAFEAKKMGEVSPYVGKRTYITVLSIEKNVLKSWEFKPEQITELEENFKKFGPQPYRSDE